jgi:hypothetical protein
MTGSQLVLAVGTSGSCFGFMTGDPAGHLQFGLADLAQLVSDPCRRPGGLCRVSPKTSLQRPKGLVAGDDEGFPSMAQSCVRGRESRQLSARSKMRARPRRTLIRLGAAPRSHVCTTASRPRRDYLRRLRCAGRGGSLRRVNARQAARPDPAEATLLTLGGRSVTEWSWVCTDVPSAAGVSLCEGAVMTSSLSIDLCPVTTGRKGPDVPDDHAGRVRRAVAPAHRGPRPGGGRERHADVAAGVLVRG